MAQVWHLSLWWPTVCLYWRNSRGNSSSNRHSRQTQVNTHSQSFNHNLISLELVSFRYLLRIENAHQSLIQNGGILLVYIIENKMCSLFSRSSWNVVGANPSALPFPDGCRLDHHSAAREHPALQHPADPHDPHHTGNTSLRELWNSTTATVCFIFNTKNGQSFSMSNLCQCHLKYNLANTKTFHFLCCAILASCYRWSCLNIAIGTYIHLEFKLHWQYFGLNLVTELLTKQFAFVSFSVSYLFFFYF